MEKTVRLNADQREDLVAYLDGELPHEQVLQIDHIIARSEVARYEVEALARTWEMLDILPSAPASEDFTNKTMSNLKILEKPYNLAEQWWYLPVRRVCVLTGWLAAFGLCGWLGFQITRYWIPNPHDEFAGDMPVIENLDHYQEAAEFEFLNLLKTSGLFDESQEK